MPRPLKKQLRFPLEIIAICINWYATYRLSYFHLEEVMREYYRTRPSWYQTYYPPHAWI